MPWPCDTLRLCRGRVAPFALALCLMLVACGEGTTLPAATYAPQPGALPDFSHVFVIVMENRAYSDIIGNSSAPYINQLAQTYGLAARYYGVTHPSVPSYLSLIGGDYYGIQTDCISCFTSAPNLVDSLEAGHKSWRAYMEGLPSPCYVGNAGNYAQKHDPFIYFNDIRTNPARCDNIVPLTQFQRDLAGGSVPDFAWITPNLCNDMHDCSTSTGDRWLASFVPQILASPAWQQGGVLFITWDEGTSNDGCCRYARGGHIATLIISPLGKPHYSSTVPYDHYSLLRTICDAWRLTEPGHSAAPETPAMTDFFIRQR